MIRIDPDATYTDRALAAAFGITEHTLRDWRKRRRGGKLWFPRPFFQGRTPHWRGQVILAWQEKLQQDALA